MSTTQINDASVRACAAQRPALVNYAYGILHNVQDAEDAVQSAFVKLWKFRARFRGQCKVSTYLFYIVKHQAYNLFTWRRKCGRNRTESFDDPDYGGEAMAAPESVQGCDQPAALAVLAAGIATLSPKLRKIMVLSLKDGITYLDLAASIGMPVGTVKSRLSRARVSLRRSVMADACGREFVPAA
jgi:RNA polymerase sigma-70 factor (ECF subfamily)